MASAIQAEGASWQRRDRVAVLTLDRPQRLNALGAPLVRGIVQALEQIEQDGEIGAIVLAGSGRAFSAGGDIGDVAARVSGDAVAPRLELMRHMQSLVVALRDSPLPVVAAVSGPAYGAGMSTVLACDLVVAARDAVFCEIFLRRNLVPDLGSAWLLPRTIGAQLAKELMLLGGEISAERALELGLVNRLVDDRAAAEQEALALATRLAQIARAPLAMTKELINRSQGLSFEDSLRLERQAQAIAFGTDETRAAMQAFLTKAEG